MNGSATSPGRSSSSDPMRPIPSSSRSRRGQAFTEFLLAIPILLALFFIITQGTKILNRAERAEMSLWPLLRADTFDFKHNDSEGDVRDSVAANVFPGEDVHSSTSTELSPVDAYAWVNPFMWPMDRTVTVRVNFQTYLDQSKYGRWVTLFGAIPTGGTTVQVKSSAQMIQDQL